MVIHHQSYAGLQWKGASGAEEIQMYILKRKGASGNLVLESKLVLNGTKRLRAGLIRFGIKGGVPQGQGERP